MNRIVHYSTNNNIQLPQRSNNNNNNNNNLSLLPVSTASKMLLQPPLTPLLPARRKNATRETTNALKAWLIDHRKNPYPTKGEKIMLAIITKMTLTQVSTWFANARRRLKKDHRKLMEKNGGNLIRNRHPNRDKTGGCFPEEEEDDRLLSPPGKDSSGGEEDFLFNEDGQPTEPDDFLLLDENLLSEEHETATSPRQSRSQHEFDYETTKTAEENTSRSYNNRTTVDSIDFPDQQKFTPISRLLSPAKTTTPSSSHNISPSSLSFRQKHQIPRTNRYNNKVKKINHGEVKREMVSNVSEGDKEDFSKLNVPPEDFYIPSRSRYYPNAPKHPWFHLQCESSSKSTLPPDNLLFCNKKTNGGNASFHFPHPQHPSFPPPVAPFTFGHPHHYHHTPYFHPLHPNYQSPTKDASPEIGSHSQMFPFFMFHEPENTSKYLSAFYNNYNAAAGSMLPPPYGLWNYQQTAVAAAAFKEFHEEVSKQHPRLSTYNDRSIEKSYKVKETSTRSDPSPYSANDGPLVGDSYFHQDHPKISFLKTTLKPSSMIIPPPGRRHDYFPCTNTSSYHQDVALQKAAKKLEPKPTTTMKSTFPANEQFEFLSEKLNFSNTAVTLNNCSDFDTFGIKCNVPSLSTTTTVSITKRSHSADSPTFNCCGVDIYDTEKENSTISVKRLKPTNEEPFNDFKQSSNSFTNTTISATLTPTENITQLITTPQVQSSFASESPPPNEQQQLCCSSSSKESKNDNIPLPTSKIATKIWSMEQIIK